jgi:hypothetical protein
MFYEAGAFAGMFDKKLIKPSAHHLAKWCYKTARLL